MTAAVIAVDGPGGAGKTTVSRGVAMQLGWHHLDTGAYYRAATMAVQRAGLDPGDVDAVIRRVAGSVIGYEQGRVQLDGDDVTDAIRSAVVTADVSAVSAIPAVRELLVAAQRLWVGRHGGQAVVEGRDIGTVVFPDAVLKVFVTARPEVRAARRAGEDGSEEVEAVAADLARRDRFDAGRRVAPLQRAEDAVLVDTSDMSIDQVIDRIVGLARRRLAGG